VRLGAVDLRDLGDRLALGRLVVEALPTLIEKTSSSPVVVSPPVRLSTWPRRLQPLSSAPAAAMVATVSARTQTFVSVVFMEGLS
jgi:hypothetical protein